MTPGRLRTWRPNCGRVLVASSALAAVLTLAGSISPAFSNTVTKYTGTGISVPLNRGRGGRGVVVHQRWEQLDRADHHFGGGDQRHRNRDQSARGSRPVRTGCCGSPTTRTIRSGGSPPRDGDQLHRHRDHGALSHRGRSRRGVWFTNTGTTRSGGSPPRGHDQLHQRDKPTLRHRGRLGRGVAEPYPLRRIRDQRTHGSGVPLECGFSISSRTV